MPNIIAHCWCGEVAYTKTETEKVRNAIKKYHGVYMLGCQGPDPFYLYHRLPWQSKKDFKTVLHYGDVLHKLHINDTMRMLLEEAKRSGNELDIAYVMGFMCHWSLDAVAHPYIFYETDSLTEDIGNFHQLFESIIDKGVLMSNDIDVRDFQTYKLLKHPAETAERVWNLLKPIFRELDGIDLPLVHVEESIRDFHSIQKLFYDPTGSKHKWVSLLENAFGQKGMATGMMVPIEYDNEMDPMNYSKREWVHPCDNTIKSTQTFEEMHKFAINRTLQLMTLFEAYLNDKADTADILEIIDNRTFDTGMAPGTEMKYFRKDLKNENL